MKKSLVNLALALAAVAFALTATLPACTQSSQSSGQVTIKDPAEYNAYVTALNQQRRSSMNEMSAVGKPHSRAARCTSSSNSSSVPVSRTA